MEIYVGNIPLNTKEEELRFLFHSYGTIVFVDIKNRCEPHFAFILFDNPWSAFNAVTATNGSNYKGSQLKVKLLKPKEDYHENKRKIEREERLVSKKQQKSIS